MERSCIIFMNSMIRYNASMDNLISYQYIKNWIEVMKRNFKMTLGPKYDEARADVKQINTNKLNEIKVFINPKTTTQRFEGPFSSGQMDSIAVYGVISEDTNYKWLRIKVPLCLNFKLDQNKIFKAGKSVAWNRKNAKQYLVRYTDQFKLVVSIEPIN